MKRPPVGTSMTSIIADIFLSALDRSGDELQSLIFPIAANIPGLNFAFHGPVAPGATINSSTGQFSWTPTEQQGPGFYTFTVWATQPGNSLTPIAPKTFHVTVLETNQPPVVNPLSVSSPITIDEKIGKVQFTATA